MRPQRPGARVLAGVLALLAACAAAGGCEGRRYGDGPPAPLSVPPADAAPPPRFIPDGAASKDEVWTRATAAWKARDYEIVAHCVAPGARASWLRTLLAMSFFATMGHFGSRGTPMGDLSGVLERNGATFTVEERLSGIPLEEMPQILLDRAKDHAALLAGFLAWGDKYGVPGDPAKGIQAPEKLAVAAVDPDKGLVGSLTEGPTSSLTVNVAGPPGLPGLLARLATGGPAPAQQRFREEGGVWYLDE